ncbi:hypothetical protein PRIPAC_72254, partial [Pristionchus pacificus]
LSEQELQQLQQLQQRYPYPPYPPYMMGPMSPGSTTMTIQPYPFPQPMYLPYMYAPQAGQAPGASGASGAPSAPITKPAPTVASGGRFGSGVAAPNGADRGAHFRDDASSIEQLGASVGKVVVSQDGLFANSLIRRADGSVLDITPPGILREDEEDRDKKTVTYEAQTPFGESVRATRRE